MIHHASDGARAKQEMMAQFNRRRVTPTFPNERWPEHIDIAARAAEQQFLEDARSTVAAMLADVPTDAASFLGWIKALRENGPGQGDPLFPWLAETASFEEMRWFLLQEVAGEAGFEDLIALTQIKMPVRVKLEMARNYWDEMGRGNQAGMHGLMLERLADSFDISQCEQKIIPEALALGNMMMALATNRRFAYQSVGALGVIELTSPTRASYIVAGLKRLGVTGKQRQYFSLHGVLDVKHAEAWNKEVIVPLVENDSRCAKAIAEGALLRLWSGAKCFQAYRRHFGL